MENITNSGLRKWMEEGMARSSETRRWFLAEFRVIRRPPGNVVHWIRSFSWLVGRSPRSEMQGEGRVSDFFYFQDYFLHISLLFVLLAHFVTIFCRLFYIVSKV